MAFRIFIWVSDRISEHNISLFGRAVIGCAERRDRLRHQQITVFLMKTLYAGERSRLLLEVGHLGWTMRWLILEACPSQQIASIGH